MAVQRQVQPARVTAVQGLQLFLGLCQGGQHMAGQSQQLLARRRQHQGAALAKKKLQAKTGLQLFELMGEGRLGQIQALRRAGQRPLLGQCGQGSQMFDFQA